MIERRLLVVDDEIDFCTFVQRVGGRMGYEVETATRAKDFKQSVVRFQPGTIVLDINMPDADGIELIQWLTAQGSHPRIIVATGGDPQFAKIIQIMGNARGIASVAALLKPVSVAELQAALGAPPSEAASLDVQSTGAALSG